ncbi:DUF4352 domain-containing protein [Blastococcus sp. HT6-30]|uniref:DUF4352 domain-containing protein n=1 Tax=Blastococcus sp. HT6-30 TaxID=3144843 RepID=UPI00321AB2C4
MDLTQAEWVEYCAGEMEGGDEALDQEVEANADPTPTEPEYTAPEFATIGEPVPFDGGITAGTVTLNGIRRITAPEAEYSSATPVNGSWLVADVTVQVSERREPGALLVSSYDFRAQDEAGIVYPADNAPLRTSLSMDLTAGRQVRGEVAFDAPEGPLLIDWAPSFDGPTATWQVTG